MGSVFYETRHQLWHSLFSFVSSLEDSWSLIGDFNALLGAHEKIGHLSLPICCREFQCFAEDFSLILIDAK